ncbi:MAG: FtsX-like permease family protein [Roseivirga sp.]|nr:FtsX-like permease family protein [Roseivirga sp.]
MDKSKNHITPPRLATKLLLWFLKDDLAEEVRGDLEEKFHQTTSRHSAFRAKRNYWYQVLSYMRPFALKNNRSIHSNQTAMFKHNLLISYRSFLRFKSTFFINLTGLTCGLAGTLLIYLWVADEVSMDKFHEKENRIYQVMRNMDRNGGITTTAYMPGRLADELITNYPEVEAASMVWPPNFFGSNGYLSFEDSQFKASAQFVDEDFLRIMSFPLIEGNSTNILQSKTEVLISETLANKVFGSTDNLIGKTLHWNEGRATGDYLISGIFEDVPKNSTMQFDMLLNAEVMMEAYKYMEHWGNSNPEAMVLLKEGVSPEAFNSKIEKLIQNKVKNSSSTLFIQKHSDRYLNGSYENGVIAGGRISYVRLFSIVALIILVIACINFMNLSTAKAAGRLKEIGVKKALGARRKTLITQYFTESFLITFLSALLAVGITSLLLPQFNIITGKSLYLDINAELVISILVIVGIAGLLAGSYPALYLSGLRTTESLKGKLVKRFGDIWARKGLVVFQFSVSVVMVVSVLIVARQLDFIQSKNLGYDRDNVIMFANTGIEDTNYPNFLADLESIPGVLNTSSTGHDLTGDHGQTSGINWPGKEAGQHVDFINLEMSSGFIETMGIEMLMGRTFDRNRTNEESKIIFNETAIKQMGLEDPIGKTIKLWGNEKEIIGVVKDFHAQSLYEPILPTFIQAYPVLNGTVVKIQAGTKLDIIEKIEASYEEFSNGLLFDFRFMDADYQAMYESEKRVSALSKYFAVVAVIISCLGLLGLTAFTAEKRSKEIGVRKVLGAEVWRIVLLLSGDFTKMVLVALSIGLPISYFIAQQWLQDFAFGINLDIWYFGLAGIIMVAIAWLTVGLQTLKAARANPVDSLRSE